MSQWGQQPPPQQWGNQQPPQQWGNQQPPQQWGNQPQPGFPPPPPPRRSNAKLGLIIAAVCGGLVLIVLAVGIPLLVHTLNNREPSHKVTFWYQAEGGTDAAKLSVSYTGHKTVTVPSSTRSWTADVQTSKGTKSVILLVVIAHGSNYPDNFAMTCGVNVDGQAVYASSLDIVCAADVKLPAPSIGPAATVAPSHQ
jgi:hypothetical protein